MKRLQIVDLHVEVEGKEILSGITLTFHPQKIHALMGPNGSGKSTLALALMGHPKYKITKGKILLEGQDITHEKPEKRAQLGLFLSFQHPPEISGVSFFPFLRTMVNNLTGKNHSVLDFQKLLLQQQAVLKMDASFSKRHLHAGLSGGEKKKVEVLQLLLSNPKYTLLDETDSGLDIDSLKTVAVGIKKAMKEQKTGIIIITHYQRFLQYLPPDEVSVLHQGKIIATGGKELAKKIEKNGFEGLIKNAH